MGIYLVPFVVSENEIPLTLLSGLPIPFRTENFPQFRYVLPIDGNVQILVRPELLAEERIHTPTAIDPDSDTRAFQFAIKSDNVARRHRYFCVFLI